MQYLNNEYVKDDNYIGICPLRLEPRVSRTKLHPTISSGLGEDRPQISSTANSGLPLATIIVNEGSLWRAEIHLGIPSGEIWYAAIDM